MAADTEQAPKPPPHLRASNPDDQGGECETCTHYQHGHCDLYPPLVVDGEWLCDSYKDSGRPDPDASSDRALKSAGAKARQAFRDAREQQ